VWTSPSCIKSSSSSNVNEGANRLFQKLNKSFSYPERKHFEKITSPPQLCMVR
jgi:hypothetical protein